MSEATEQAALFRWAAWCQGQLPALAWLFHVPNGGQRGKAVAGQMKAQGVKRGVPDVLLPVAMGKHPGLVIEMKDKAGRVSPEQKQWLAHLTEQGWRCAVCYDWQAAAREIVTYLQRDPKEYGL